MLATITFIELKTPFKFFALSKNALHIIRQLKTTNCLQYKNTGFWTKHYTMTLWGSEEDMKNFARSGAHLQAMKVSASIAKEIKTHTYPTNKLPDWKEAKEILKNVKVIQY